MLARALSAAPLVAALAGGCGGDQKTAAEAHWSPEPTEDDRPLRSTEALEEENAPTPLDAKPASRALVGVRPDLALATGTGSATCACLTVVVGNPGDAKFQWQAGAPNAGADALAIAVSARGLNCPGGEADETRRRPSISAVDVEGNDVVVEIEELPDGAPLASGALIPQPGSGGSIYVRGRDKSVVYARSASGARCKVY